MNYCMECLDFSISERYTDLNLNNHLEQQHLELYQQSDDKTTESY